jgi:hypothetical protein
VFNEGNAWDHVSKYIIEQFRDKVKRQDAGSGTLAVQGSILQNFGRKLSASNFHPKSNKDKFIHMSIIDTNFGFKKI